MKKVIILILAVALVGGVVYMWNAKKASAPTNTGTEVKTENQSVKEFTMTAYYDPATQKAIFSLPEMNVKKGDKVKVKITNTLGMHDFVIDELAVAKELPLNQEVVVEFTADKAGEFVYYCSKPGHRESGQWGTLKVAE